MSAECLSFPIWRQCAGTTHTMRTFLISNEETDCFWFTLNWILILLLWRFQVTKSGKYLMISRREIAHSNKESVWRLRMEEICFTGNPALQVLQSIIKTSVHKWPLEKHIWGLEHKGNFHLKEWQIHSQAVCNKVAKIAER